MTSSLRRTSVLVKHKSKQLGLNTKCALNMPSATFKRSWDRDWLFQGSKKKNYMERNRTCVFRLARDLKHIIPTSCLQYKLLNTSEYTDILQMATSKKPQHPDRSRHPQTLRSKSPSHPPHQTSWWRLQRCTPRSSHPWMGIWST